MGKRNTELDVLVTVKDYGAIGVFDGRHTKASERLFSLYHDFSVAYGGKVSVFVDALGFAPKVHVESQVRWLN